MTTPPRDGSSSTLLAAMLQLLLAADRLEDVREAVAHGAELLSHYATFTLREFTVGSTLSVTLRRGQALDPGTKALERRLCHFAETAGRSVSTLERFQSEELQEMTALYRQRQGLFLARPLRAYGESVGVVALHYSGRIALADSEFDGLRKFLDSAGVALFNARARHELRHLAYTDPLTGLPNRRSLEEELSRLGGTELSLLLIDFDGLKEVNDNLGYDSGDTLIAAVAAAIAGHVREGELAVRFGGDEFVVVLPETHERLARVRAAEFTEALDATAVPDEIAPHFHGASVGWATATPGEDPHAVLARASKEMHSRKRRRKTDVPPDAGGGFREGF